jgi:hypothetical protein
MSTWWANLTTTRSWIIECPRHMFRARTSREVSGRPIHGRYRVATDPLDFLTSWYLSQCDGDWEQDAGIEIGTLDNPGWWLSVTLIGTELEGKLLDRAIQERAKDDWARVRSDGRTFDANGGPLNLRELLAAFQEFAEEHAADR